MYCECYNTQLFITFKWEQILQTRSHIMMKSQHNSVLHAFSVPDWSEMCGVVGVLTVLLLLPTQYTAGEIFKMWCQEFDKYLLANIYIDIDITLLISDMDFLYQFNLRLHNFEGFFSNVEKKKIQKLAGLWLVGEVVNHVGLYGSKVAEGCSAFQRRSFFRFVDIQYIFTICIFHGTYYTTWPAWKPHDVVTDCYIFQCVELTAWVYSHSATLDTTLYVLLVLTWNVTPTVSMHYCHFIIEMPYAGTYK